MEILNNIPVEFCDGRKYNIEIGAGNLSAVGEFAASISPFSQAFIITDKNVAQRYLSTLTNGLKIADIQCHCAILPPGEKTKTLKNYVSLIKRITEFDDARDLVVIALGGGVVGDLAGFVAATYKRGVKLIQVPTTLLSCVDSSVGGKTAVDLPTGKNLVGSFYQPVKVVIDLDTLRSLPSRELRAGYAEVVKTALIFDKLFFEYLEKYISEVICASTVHTAFAVRRCCENKAKVVVEDERDISGHRALLNFGHTFGHAAEATLGYKILHGEGVAVGMVCAAELSKSLGMINKEDVLRIEDHIKAAGLPVKFAEASPYDMIDRMMVDKKFTEGRSRFVLLEDIGRAVLVGDISKNEVMRILRKRIMHNPAK